MSINPTACNGTYTRHPEQGWLYPWGDPVPGSEDMTISRLYNHIVIGGNVWLSAALARNTTDLQWCLAYPEPDPGILARFHARDPRNVDSQVVVVPVEDWDERAREPLGMWAPELHPDRLLTQQGIADVAGITTRTVRQYLAARDAMPRPQGWHAASPWWTQPIVARWIEDRPARGERAGDVWWAASTT